MKKQKLLFKWKGFLTALLCVITLSGFAQTKTITGTVFDEQKQPIIGASVKVQGTTNGTMTNANGQFTLNNVAENATLEVSYVGMTKQTIPVSGKTTLEVVLVDDQKTLGEVVVVGYGTQKKANLTGSVNVIKPEMLIGKSTPSLATAMQGTTPGVTIISRPGDLGNDMGTINVRGRGNLGASSPLFVIDGVQSTEADFQRINPNDVESINVLKDAAASAIYGSRAAYGVFLVITKKGKEGKAKISYNGYYGWQTPTILPKKVNSENYAMLINEANLNAGKSIVYNEDIMKLIRSGEKTDLYPNNDWYSLVYQQSAPVQEHNVSVSGGGKTRYFVSGTFYNQNSLIPDRKLDRYSFRTNTERDFTDKLRVGTNISFVKDDWARQGDFSITDLDRMTPLTVARHSDGTWGTVTSGSQDATLAENNPLRKMSEYGRADRQITRLNGNVNATFKPIKELEINGVLSYSKTDVNSSTFENKLDKILGFIDKQPMNGTEKAVNKLSVDWSTSSRFMSQFYGTYSKAVGVNDFKLMVGTQYETNQLKRLGASRKEYPSNQLDEINAGSEKAENLGNSGSIVENASFSTFGRFNYAYAEKYLFEANIRFDRSSQFSKENRLGTFPSFSAAWRITEEDFMKNIKWLNNLKLRASWGKLGYINNVGNYDYLDMLKVGSSGYIMNGAKQDGVWPWIQPNRNLSWESVTAKNIGIDVAFFNNKLDFQLDVFDKLTTNILLKLPQPLELGIKEDNDPKKDERSSTNAGKVNNKGIEFSVNYRDQIGDFKYQISGNVTKIWNKIVTLNGLPDQIQSQWILREGEAVGSFYGYQAEGLFVNPNDVKNHVFQNVQTKPGDIKYLDYNGDGKFNADDRTILGNDVPYFTYGLGFTASYKGFDLSVQGQGVKDVKVNLTGEAALAFFNGASAKEYLLGRWTKENPDPNAVYPRILPTSDNTHNEYFSSFWLFNADYFRIKSIILGYNIPSSLTRYIGADQFRLYLSATNFFTLRGDKRMKDFDPEMPSARGTYPNLKVLSLGINVTF